MLIDAASVLSERRLMEKVNCVGCKATCHTHASFPYYGPAVAGSELSAVTAIASLETWAKYAYAATVDLVCGCL